MAFTLFKPNKKVSGAILSVSFSAKADKGNGRDEKGDKSFYFRLTSQTGWDEKKRRGTFKDGYSMVSKMSPTEVAGIVNAIRHNRSLEKAVNQEYVYHEAEDSATIISFLPFFNRVKDEETGEWGNTGDQKGFGLRVTKKNKDGSDSKTLGVGFTFAESELFAQFLSDGLTHIFNAWRSEEVAAYKAATDNRKPNRTEEKRKSKSEEDADDLEF